MNYLKISIAIFLALAASRFVPHPPNFTSLLALSFYVPAILGRKFLPSLLISFIITDFIIGFHNVVFFTWGSVILIGIISKFFLKSIFSRLSGALMGAVIFFLFSNFGVWINGMYGYSLDGLILCYTMAIPFFSYSLISTLIFSISLEMIMIASKQINYFKNIN
tara:strand:+ start:524 stop:1015 length:492 start_codon:yes stop_codon:yes gene_type:complete